MVAFHTAQETWFSRPTNIVTSLKSKYFIEKAHFFVLSPGSLELLLMPIQLHHIGYVIILLSRCFHENVYYLGAAL